FIGIFAYVGIEQGLGDWMSDFLKVRHGFDAQTEGAQAVSNFWLAMVIGGALGLVLLKLVDSRKVLLSSSLGTLAGVATALFGPADVSRYAIMATGFALSVVV